MSLLNKISEKKIILISFIISIAYWTYLFFFSEMSIVWDAYGFEKIGKLIHEQGWPVFFKTGPSREPFYPFLVSLSLALSDLLHIPYQYFQKIIQITLLFSTQILIWMILRRIKVHVGVASIIILYLGLSPALAGSAFSLFSEIATYPFVLGVIITSVLAWRFIEEEYSPKLWGVGLGLAFLFAVLTLTKSIFEHVFLIFIVPFFLVFVKSIFRKDTKRLRNSCIFLAIVIFSFYSLIFSYKSLNKRYNGNFTITDVRGVAVFYGATARRSEEFNSKKLLTFAASIPGEGVCRSLFNEEECFYWSFITVDNLMGEKLGQVNWDRPYSQIQKEFLVLTKNEFLKNPAANGLFIFLEGFKIFFWESTNMGTVLYPAFLTRLFQTPIFKNFLRLSVSLLTMISVFYALFYLFFNGMCRREVFNSRMDTLLFCMILIGSFTSLYALCYILIRYSFPIVPLFMICIAVFLDQAVLPVFQRKP